LELTIDANIQDVADKALAKGVQAHGGHTGIALVMEVETGNLLAVSNYPFFNPNFPGKTEMFVWKNRAFKDQFEPGSTMKVFSLAAVLEQGKVSLDEIIDVENGRMKIGRHWIRDTHRSEELSARNVIGQSSNVGIAKLTQRIEKEELLSLLTRFGFGKKTGVETDYEVKGRIQKLSNWADITYANISFGQGIAVSAIQLVTAFAALGNEGLLMRPRLIRRILTEDGRELVPSRPEPVDQILSKEVARAALDAMEACTGPDGTAPTAAIRGYGVAGKTGTAQKPATGYRRGKKVEGEKKGYAEDAWISSFVGLVPASDPKLAILIIVDEPEGRGFGGVVAAPIFKEIASWSLRYLGVPSEEIRPIKVSSVSKARKEKLPEVPQVGSDGGYVGSPARVVGAGGVPDLLGESMSVVLRKAKVAGLQVNLEGTGRSFKQSLPPGTPLPENKNITVYFRSPGERSAAVPGGVYAP
jgi:cell division protein FtsI (penicillin-binding protein 3)